jgi:hypothetical protein
MSMKNRQSAATQSLFAVLSAAAFAAGAIGAGTCPAQDTATREWRTVTNFRTINYAAMQRGGDARAMLAGKEFPAGDIFDGDWLKGWSAPREAVYPVVIHRDLGTVVRANRLRVGLGPEVLACPIVYTHNVNLEGTGVGMSMKVGNLAPMLDWMGRQDYQPIFFSEFLRFVRSKRLPPGVTKPLVLLFCTGQRGVYEHAFPLLRQRKMKFNSTCWELKGADPRFLTPPQIREMIASGLFEPGIYTKWTTHSFGPDKGPVIGNTTVAFPLYDAASNQYEPFGHYEERIYRQAADLVGSLRNEFGFQGEVVWEVPSSFYSLTMLRICRRLDIAMLVNTGEDLNLYGSQTLPNLGMVSMSDSVGSLESRQRNIVAMSGAPAVREYRYEVYVSAAKKPHVGQGWETHRDWHKVVFERPGAGVEIDPLYPRSAEPSYAGVVDGLNGSYVKFCHLRLKVLGEKENRRAVVNELEVYYETANESELQEMRLRNLEREVE